MTLALGLLALSACGREAPPWLRAQWAIGTFYAQPADADPPTTFAGLYEFTTDGEFLVDYEYCDGAPPLTGRNQWFAADEDTVIIGPIAPATELDFPVLSLVSGTAVPGTTAGEIVVELKADEGPGGRLILAPGRLCFADGCASPPTPCP